eukprot:8223324-Alexandrium_andersonii.AAC.1
MSGGSHVSTRRHGGRRGQPGSFLQGPPPLPWPLVGKGLLARRLSGGARTRFRAVAGQLRR